MVYGRFGDNVMIHNKHVIFTGGWTATTPVVWRKETRRGQATPFLLWRNQSSLLNVDD
jgi:hypothetical protein